MAAFRIRRVCDSRSSEPAVLRGLCFLVGCGMVVVLAFPSSRRTGLGGETIRNLCRRSLPGHAGIAGHRVDLRFLLPWLQFFPRHGGSVLDSASDPGAGRRFGAVM